MNGKSTAGIKSEPGKSMADGLPAGQAGFKPTLVICSISKSRDGIAINSKHEFHSTTNSWLALKEKI